MAGIARSVTKTSDEDGREVLRVIVDYYDGAAPDLKWNVVWDKTPVDVVLASAARDHSQGGATDGAPVGRPSPE